ncbi:GNAT family N-acetyltransferase [Anaeromyxobacter sp. Fw109-5]|uniref:bifunctional acetate--CoA ligase family protein/GNAT family N-acetyltransferase n=1 Tax=Anaeromyxobacter sp. (strain Fw109-5) TaxID=404589 RepID=UPI0000ED8A9F|nr:GNAT family N-acetyltransferase [Anaeromyxobacter sp. Fw109-5]ABS27360.1 GCN5-related N-acetyltransferase [Anaeromyxobacter sp. Fw109-5]
MRPHPFVRVFAPRAIAVFGAGERESPGDLILRNVVAGGFEGPIHVVGEAAELPAGVRRCASLAELEGEVDLAIVAAPPASIPEIVGACAERHVAGAVIAASASGSVGPGEPDPDAAAALLAAARGGVRLLGPNSVGLARPDARLNATFTSGSASPGSIGLVSQSGALCATALDWAAAHRIGFSAVVSLGDALDVDFGEVLEYLALDPATKSVLLYVETLRAARPFLSGLRLAARLKPVVVVKAGRHGAGADGAPPASSDDAFDAALARAGAVRVESMDRMFAAARLLATPRPVSGNRLAVVTNARGPGLLAADRADELGVVVAPLADATRTALDALVPESARSNPLDLLGDADPARYRSAVELCLGDPNVDAVLAVLAPYARSLPAETADAVVAASRGGSKPIVACWMGEELVRSARARFVEARLPDFSSPEAAVDAFALLASHARNQRLLRQVPGPLAPDAIPHVDRARELVRAALARGHDRLTAAELRRLLAAVGIRDRDAAGQRVTGTELFVRVGRDALFGPVIRFGRASASGPGGEAVVALPPLDTAIIQTLVRTSRIASVFTAPGGMTAPEVAAFERTLWGLSAIVSELPELRELEIAPVVVSGDEVYASGARASVAPAVPEAGRYGHMAIHPYPTDVGERWRLPGGDTITVRPIRPEDAEMEASFVRNLSENARHFRFMIALRELTREMLIRFTQIDYDRELALVALVEREGKETQIAVARYARTDPETAHVAIVVADAWQGRGIGARLFRMLIAAARARGITRLEGEVLHENTSALALMERLGFSIRRDPESPDLCLIELGLAGR